MAKNQSITLTVRGESRSLTVAQKLAAAQARRGTAVGGYVWPQPEACYLPKSEESTAIRSRNYFDALAECDNVVDTIVGRMAAGSVTLTVVVESGARVNGGEPDANGERSVYANVIGQQALKELCALPGVVLDVEPDAESPLDYVTPDKD